MPDHTPRLPEYLDSTMRACFSSCPQKFFYEYCQRLAPTSTSVDLIAGGAIASALEAARRAFYGEGKDKIAARQAAFTAYLSAWGDYDAPEGHAKSCVNCWAALDNEETGYFDTYPFDTDKLRPMHYDDGRPAVEFSFAVPLPINHPETGLPFIYSGRFDMLGTIGGKNYVVDEKTTGRSFASNWVDQWKMRGQFLGYVWAARQAGYEVEGAIVRGILIQKTQFKQLETPPMPYPDWMVEAWYKQLIRDVERLTDLWKEYTVLGVGFDKSFGDACSMYSGCHYVALCTARNPELWYGDYTERLWNPLEKDPTKEGA